MKRARYLIVGNSTAAVGAVEGIRKVDPEAGIVLVSRESYHTYSRPLISHLLAGEIDEERMHYRPRDFYEANGVDARLGVEVARVDADSRVVKIAGGGRIAFETLLVATGGRPFVPPIEGAGVRGVFTFTSWDDSKAIAGYLDETGTRKAVVIGGGLIGIKSAEALRARGLDVTVVELADRVLPLALDETASRMAADSIADAGVDLVCGTTVERIRSEGGAVAGVTLASGREIDCGLVVVAIGVVPDVGLVEGTDIRTDRGIVIDERCETNVSGIYAAGDVAQGVDALTGASRPIPIFPNAYRQGNVAGVNMAALNMGGREARRHTATTLNKDRQDRQGKQAPSCRSCASLLNAVRCVSFAMNSVEVFGLSTISAGLATVSGDGYEVLARRDARAGTYKRLVLRDGRVVGALFVGDIDRAGIFTGLIRHGVDVSGISDLLLTEQFGLLSLPADYRKHVVTGEGIEV